MLAVVQIARIATWESGIYEAFIFILKYRVILWMTIKGCRCIDTRGRRMQYMQPIITSWEAPRLVLHLPQQVGYGDLFNLDMN